SLRRRARAMPISLKCRECKSTLRIPEHLAGKKVKCPKCQATLVVPADEEDEVVAEVAADDRDDRVADAPAPKRKAPPRVRDEGEEEGDDRREAVRTDRKRRRDEEDEEEERPRGKRKGRRDDDRGRSVGKYVPCPRCGEEGPKKVVWTWWGSFYGPAMFNHV